MGRLPQYVPAPDVAHGPMKIRRAYARDHGKTMAPGMVGSPRAASGILNMTWPPCYGHHTRAQCPPHGLGWKSQHGIFEMLTGQKGQDIGRF